MFVLYNTGVTFCVHRFVLLFYDSKENLMIGMTRNNFGIEIYMMEEEISFQLYYFYHAFFFVY